MFICSDILLIVTYKNIKQITKNLVLRYILSSELINACAGPWRRSNWTIQFLLFSLQ